MRKAVSVALPAVRVTAPPLAAVEARDRAQVDGFSLDESFAMERALDALAAFVRRVGFDVPSGLLREPEFYRARTFLGLDTNARRHLDLVKTQGANPKATLFATLDRCRTAMGSRMLGRWILAPLVDAASIARRAERVEALVNDYPARANLQELLAGVYDLERIAQKVRFRRAGPRDLGSLRRTLQLLGPLCEALPPALASFRERIDAHDELRALLERTLVAEPPATLLDGGVILPDASPEVAECLTQRSEARERIVALEERERVRTGIDAQGQVRQRLRIRHRGQQIQRRAGSAGLRAQTNALERRALRDSRTQGTRDRDRQRAEPPASARGGALREPHGDHRGERREPAGRRRCAGRTRRRREPRPIAGERGYVRPVFVETSTLDIVDGRHPVMEAIAGVRSCPTTLHLAEASGRFVLLTVPTWAGSRRSCGKRRCS